MRKGAVVIILLCKLYVFSCASKGYNRKIVQKKHPGFGTDYLIFIDDNNEPVIGYINSKPNARFGLVSNLLESSISFVFYSRNIPNGKHISKVEDLGSDFVNTKKTKFITHGFMSSGKSDTCITIKNNFLNNSDVNVFIMDWSPVTKVIWYDIPRLATYTVGEEYAKFINQLIEKRQLNPKDVHLIGHSLGAHVSGFCGRNVKGKVSRITGLDPALPGFTDGQRLSQSDANFVDIIHTCAGFLGMADPIGHVDFYPNGGGPPQPGCDSIIELFEGCSHGRSWVLYARSIINKEPYLASPCPNYSNLSRRNCSGGFIAMGEPTPISSRGIYYLETTDRDPFVKKIDKNK